MHLIKDENGNLLAHGHEHTHEHSHAHTHAHSHDHGHEHDHNHTHEHDHTHSQDHTHSHDHDHSHCSDDCGSCNNGCDPKKEAQAILTYMLQHNEHHAAELDQMAENLEKLGLSDSAKQIREAVSDFQKGNMRLSLALTLMKDQI